MPAPKNFITAVSAIGKDAQALVKELQPKAEKRKDLTKAELRKIAALVSRSEAAMSVAEERARMRREEQIFELDRLVESISLSLGTPGLSSKAIKDLKRLKRNKLAQLVRLKTRAALDFGGILSPAEVEEIAGVLKEAKGAVAKKKKAADFLGSLIKIATLAIGIAGKARGFM